MILKYLSWYVELSIFVIIHINIKIEFERKINKKRCW